MKKFEREAISPTHKNWEQCIQRESLLEERNNEIRTKFWRDYNRILHSRAYRRLKHKTQVFHATHNDHICTRIEHVGHVSSVSYTICEYLGLNSELAQAIAIGHDIGHTPFGHDGERVIAALAKKYYGGHFWHEKNSLHFADNIETLVNADGYYENLNLTYAVRDGFISHCGEVNEKVLFPRLEAIDLKTINAPNEYSPYTWEACVVKTTDKISYLGRDIEDALRLRILNNNQIDELLTILAPITSLKIDQINNTSIIHHFVTDLCQNSSPEQGIGFSEPYYQALSRIKAFNYKNIYLHPRLNIYSNYVEFILTTLFEELDKLYNSDPITLKQRLNEEKLLYPNLIEHFEKWLQVYSNFDPFFRSKGNYNNKMIYNLEKTMDYRKAIIDFLSSQSDHFALDSFQELIRL